MPQRSSKPKGANETAFAVLAQVTGAAAAEDGRDPAAVSLGRRGGLKGGPARAKKLSAAKRSAIARKAAKARWKAAKSRKRTKPAKGA